MTFEYTEVRRFGAPEGNHTLNSSGSYGKPPYISQESNIQISAGADFNPENFECTPGFGDGGPDGMRWRELTPGDVVTALEGSPDTIGYSFFSFANVSKIAQNATGNNFGYLMINGIDPLFDDYSNSVGNPGQPANTAMPLTWGDLPFCNPGGTPDCKASAIWNGGASYPHLRDGSYPAWSEARMICDAATGNNCTIAQDQLGAEALMANLQQDIHFEHQGGVPDLLPFDDAKAWTVTGYGDVQFIRDHSAAYIAADDTQDYNNGPNSLYNSNPAMGGGPQSTHQSLQGAGQPPAVTATCGVANNGTPATSDECGGDVGGFILPIGTANQGGQQQ
jgi:hypothetical protein